jgi:hypothetical protein
MVEMKDERVPKHKRGRWKKRRRGRAILVDGSRKHMLDKFDELPVQRKRFRCPIAGCPQVKVE